MEIKVGEEDLIRLLKEYIEHYGVDLKDKDIHVSFMAGRKHASHAIIEILEKDDTFVSSTSVSLNENSVSSVEPVDAVSITEIVKPKLEPEKATKKKRAAKKKVDPVFDISKGNLSAMLGFEDAGKDLIKEEEDHLNDGTLDKSSDQGSVYPDTKSKTETSDMFPSSDIVKPVKDKSSVVESPSTLFGTK